MIDLSGEYFNPIIEIIQQQKNKELLVAATNEVKDLIKDCIANKKIITIFGNGGSAADAQHWAGEMVCTYKKKSRDPIPAIALTANSSVLTAWGNDCGFHEIFNRQIKAFRFQNGLSIGLSTSGSSPNVRNALTTASNLGAKTVFITGNNAPPLKGVTSHIRLPSVDTPIIQTLTQILYHNVCELIEQS